MKIRIKKVSVAITVIAMLVCLTRMQSFAAGESVTVYVTIANGSLVMIQEPVTVTDTDNDGTLTINDTLRLAHEAGYTGEGTGYATEHGQYGLAITMLWGIENGSGYGYYVNNNAACGLNDPVENGDFISAFVFTDTAAFSDTYCFFDSDRVSITAGKECGFTLTLSAVGYDAGWNPVTLPVNDATILIDGTETSFKTDASGKAFITINSGKTCVISAKSATATLVPPVCVASISPETGDNGIIIVAAAFISFVSLAIMLSPGALVVKVKKKANEK